jgi:hypothetical protein
METVLSALLAAAAEEGADTTDSDEEATPAPTPEPSPAVCGPGHIIIITRAAHSKALIVRGAGYAPRASFHIVHAWSERYLRSNVGSYS